MSTRMGLRERNRLRTRKDIETAAWELFRARGFEATTVDQIAAAAGVSKGTFFRHFAAKEDVVFADHGEAVARLRSALAASDGPPLTRVGRALMAVGEPTDDPSREKDRARLLAETPDLRDRADRLAGDFADAVADVLGPQMGGGEEGWARARVAAGALFGALLGARHAAAAIESGNEDALVAVAFDLLDRGAAGWGPPSEGSSPLRARYIDLPNGK